MIEVATTQNALQISPVKRQKGKEKEVRAAGDGSGGEDSRTRPFQQKVAFASGHDQVEKVTVAPIVSTPQSTTPDLQAVQPPRFAPTVEYVEENAPEALEAVAQEPEVSTTDESESQELSVIDEDDDMELTMILPPSQPQGPLPSRIEATLSEPVSAPIALSAPGGPQTAELGPSIPPIALTPVPVPSIKAVSSSAVVEASQGPSPSLAQRPEAIPYNTPRSPDRLPQARTVPIVPRSVPGPSTSP